MTACIKRRTSRSRFTRPTRGLRYQPVGSVIEAVDVGVNFTRRDKKKRVDELDLMLKNGRLQTLVDPSDLVDPTSLGFAGLGDVIGVDLPNALDRYYDFVVLEDANHFDKAWQHQGRRHDLQGAHAVRVRATCTATSASRSSTRSRNRPARGSTSSTLRPRSSKVTEGASYWDFLPSLNAYYDIGGGHRIRFAASKVLARPRMDEMRANLTPGFNSSVCGGSPPCVPGPDGQPMVGERRQSGLAAVARLGG